MAARTRGTKRTRELHLDQFLDAFQQVFGRAPKYVGEWVKDESGASSEHVISVRYLDDTLHVYFEEELIAATEGLQESLQVSDQKPQDQQEQEESVDETPEEYESEVVDQDGVVTASAEQGQSDEWSLIANKLRERSAINLEVGLFVRRQKEVHGFEYEQVKDRLRSVYRADLPNKSSVSKWGQAAKAWVIDAEVPMAELSDVSVYKLYFTRKAVNRQNWRDILAWLREPDVGEQDVQQRYKDVSESNASEWKVLRLRQEVHSLLDASRVKFSTAVQSNTSMSWEQFLEMWGHLVNSTSNEDLLAVYQREMGEQEEDPTEMEVEFDEGDGVEA